jgi:hypothetical protein
MANDVLDDITRISQTILRERQGRDRGWWDRMRSCYADDATVRLSWFRGSGADFVTESQKMVSRGDASIHRLGPPVVEQHADKAFVELPAVIEVRTEVDGVEADLASAARLCYRVRREHDGTWLIRALDPIYERDTLTPSHPGDVLLIGPADVARFRSAYRFLSYVLSQRGYDVDDDLHGDDRPESIARFYQAAHDWLRAG